MSEHPADTVLLGWLESGRPAKVGRHLDECEPCLARLDDLTDLDPEARRGLAGATAPPEDLVPRTAGRVQGRLIGQESFAAFVELFALPWRTLDAVADTEPLGRRVVRPGASGDDGTDDDGERRDG